MISITVRRRQTKQWFRKQILPKKRCRRCGGNDPIVLDFHHIKPATKKAKVSRLVDCAFNKYNFVGDSEMRGALRKLPSKVSPQAKIVIHISGSLEQN